MRLIRSTRRGRGTSSLKMTANPLLSRERALVLPSGELSRNRLSAGNHGLRRAVTQIGRVQFLSRWKSLISPLEPRRALRLLLAHAPHILIGSWLLSRQVEGHLQWSGEWPFPRVLKERTGRIVSSGALIGGGVHIEVGSEGVLELGGGVFLNRGCTIICRQRVSIGAGTRLAWNVSVMDADEHQHPLVHTGQTPVTIGGGAWIGAHAVVLKGTDIGDRAVVGAGAVVTRDIPADALAAGVPARVIRTL